MDMVIINTGKLKLIDWMLRDTGAGLEALVVKLFSNNHVPTPGDVIGDYTEATFTGYAAVTVARSGYGAPSLDGDEAVITATSPPTYSCTGGGGQTCYGWYAVGATSGVLIAAQRFDSARAIIAGSSESLSPFAVRMGTLL